MPADSLTPAEFRRLLRGVLDEVAPERNRWASEVSELLDVGLLEPEQAGVVSTVATWAMLTEDDPDAREAQLGALAALSARGQVVAPLLRRIMSWMAERDLDADDAELLADFRENFAALPAPAAGPPGEPQAGNPLGPIRLRELARGLLSEAPAERARAALTVEVCHVHGREVDADESAVLATVLCWAIPTRDLRSTRPQFLHLLESLSAGRPVPRSLLRRLVFRLDRGGLEPAESGALDVLIERLGLEHSD
jgi:hypothetical protein